jgi:hypothetical protein
MFNAAMMLPSSPQLAPLPEGASHSDSFRSCRDDDGGAKLIVGSQEFGKIGHGAMVSRVHLRPKLDRDTTALLIFRGWHKSMSLK